ncbi:MAG: hypothetical protein KDD45_14795 [Bdellovibrionales bacterium]|nr:hypothetical protein [Bdellovibrionales bacterium]
MKNDDSKKDKCRKKDLSKKSFVLMFLLMSSLSVQAEVDSDFYDNGPEDNQVEVISNSTNVEVLNIKTYSNYRERRTTNGFMVSLGSENLYFPDYVSQYDQKFYEELWGQEDVSTPEITLSYKFNFKLGSFTLGAGYGQGSILDDRSGDERTISVDKYTAGIEFLADTIMPEPYFVPYGGIYAFQLTMGEYVKSIDTDFSSTSGIGTAYKIGFLIQLNWLEAETAKYAYLNDGLENTYLDVFWTQYDNSNEDPKPSVQSDLNWGAGLRVEF